MPTVIVVLTFILFIYKIIYGGSVTFDGEVVWGIR